MDAPNPNPYETPVRRGPHDEHRQPLYTMDIVALVLVIIGGINWLLVGLFNWNLVAAVFAGVPMLERLTYILVGIAAVYAAVVTPMWIKQLRTGEVFRTRPA